MREERAQVGRPAPTKALSWEGQRGARVPGEEGARTSEGPWVRSEHQAAFRGSVVSFELVNNMGLRTEQRASTASVTKRSSRVAIE